MNIGIVVYSQTENTLSVAEKLKLKLESAGHKAAIERITLASDPKDAKDIRFRLLPDLKPYEALVFAAPVQGFQLCAAMKAYLPQIPALNGRKAAVLVTKQFANAWSGATAAMKAIAEAIKAKGGVVCGQGFVSWGSKQREKDIEALVEKLGCLF